MFSLLSFATDITLCYVSVSVYVSDCDGQAHFDHLALGPGADMLHCETDI